MQRQPVDRSGPEVDGGTVVRKYQTAVSVKPVRRKNTQFALYNLSVDEDQTIDAILGNEQFSDIVVSPNHHFDEDGIFSGFRISYPSHSSGKGLPINRKMFFGHTVAEVSSSQGINDTFLRLVSDGNENRKLMTQLLEGIDESSRGHEPSFDCMPHNVEFLDTGNGKVNSIRSRTSVDSKSWNPELPDFIGIYHAFTRGYNKDSREHKIFIVCSGGCPLASESYYNLLLDLNGQSDVDEICDSEETWWLRNACFRARCRLLHSLADKFGLDVTSIKDVHSYDEDTKMVRSTTDTVYNDISTLRSGHIAIFNNAVDTTTSKNGVINPMHPKEGVWIFKGPQRSSAGVQSLGCGWGDQKSAGVFPSGAFKVHEAKRDPKRPTARGLCTVFTETNDTIVSYRCKDSETRAAGSCKKIPCEFSWYDEKYLALLSNDLGWDRNSGIIELMPIIVGITKW